MLKNVLGVVLTANENPDLYSLTAHRPLAMVPIGGRYRVTDFILSNLVNAGISNVSFFAYQPYQSLLNFFSNSRSWDLDRKNGGLKMYFQNTMEQGYTGSELMHIYRNLDRLITPTVEYVLVSRVGMICNIDFEEMADLLEADNKADVVCAYVRRPSNYHYCTDQVIFKRTGKRITSTGVNTERSRIVNLDMGMYLMSVDVFKRLIIEGVEDLECNTFQQFFYRNLKNLNVIGYEHDGFVSPVTNLSNYFKANMAILDPIASEELFYGPRKIYTVSRDEAPTYYSERSRVENSFFGTGCSIEGHIKNSVISRRVTIEPGAIVENCVIFSDTTIRSGARLKNVIVDTNCEISENNELAGNPETPLIIPKRTRI